MSTVDDIIESIRDASLEPDFNVNYGTTDNEKPPYVSVMEYSQSVDYDTAGPAFINATFKVYVIASNQADAEALADSLDAVITAIPCDLTPNALGCFQDGRTVGQLGENLYQWGVILSYSLIETPEISA